MAFPGAIPSYAGFTASHTLTADSHASQHNSEQADISAIATKVGTGASTPTSGKVLRGNGVGASTWGQTDLTTDVTGTLPIGNGGTGGTTAASARTALGVNTQSETLQAVYPVGAIYIETTGTNPATTFGFGTWAAHGSGRTMIGVGTSDQAFAAGATGGESNHTLTSAEMPSHTHVQDAHSHTYNAQSLDNSAGGSNQPMVKDQTADRTPSTNNVTAVNQNTGGGGTHNTLPPYIVTYFWKRTA